MVFIPKEVAEAIEKVVTDRRNDPGFVKYLWLNNWDLLKATNPKEYAILLSYATSNPVNYMMALTGDYAIEFNKNLSFKTNTLVIEYAKAIVDDNNYKHNYPIKIKVGSTYDVFSIEEVRAISDNINVLIYELDKVRSLI